ncbi:histidine phosphatase family protein [Clostridium sp. YIM B02515]|uniref:Histidine phosphatase family protein n=1 Tax=Clostridium rhizosphaerae TaxID=2803861 RepID=A0ABS1TED0_9CLOT|nr:histidine phosphatase family protein [Clostridium rhizosphaerae]MBL4937700.1 histidine phosphatase family protein [Clostridium rhizosphaerae]
MYTNIYFVRHAEVKYTPDEFIRPLTEKGQADATRLVKVFKDINITRVISSPYKRAVSTVELIAKDKCLDIETIDDFKERKVSDAYIEDFFSFSKRQWEDFDFCLDNGETLRITQDRGIKALYEVLRKYKGENIIIGTHGTILGVILNYFDEKYNYDFWIKMKMPDVFRFTFNDEKIEYIENNEI